MDTNVEKSIGNGLIFPIQIINGKPLVKSGVQLIQSDLTLLFAWPHTSRFFKENYGIDLRQFLEEPNDDILFDVLRTYVIWAVEEWEPRIELVTAEITRDEIGTGVILSLTYIIAATGKSSELVIPVYQMTA